MTIKGKELSPKEGKASCETAESENAKGREIINDHGLNEYRKKGETKTKADAVASCCTIAGDLLTGHSNYSALDKRLNRLLNKIRKLTSFSDFSKLKSQNNFFTKGTPIQERLNEVELCNKKYSYHDPDHTITQKGEPLKPKAIERYNKENGGHAEARILADLAKKNQLANNTLVFKVDWITTDQKTGQQVNKKNPCKQCLRMMCDVMEDCGTRIYVCNKKNKVLDLETYCKDKKNGYVRLEKILSK